MTQGLYRPLENRMLAGVCAAVAARFGITVTPVRILTVMGAFFFGVTIPLYIGLWILIPQGDE
ncbi:PspC domain-containing protein [Microbacterium hominis]|uniref:PspC domain-containing protein n=1 Tax=Microbacterium hominis TaxID=162426 RepID=A0A7D4U688_9MICO|nr:PspC domain-containing protein [Microbacterium hominis]QKJ18186.1 PspC domain-containing protein [Microbacterium hominis]